MKTLKLFFLLFLASVIISCSDSDDCEQIDWIGTYTGTADCGGGEGVATVTVTANGTDQINITYVFGPTTTFFDPITIDGCSAGISNNSGGVSASVDATLDGDKITITEVISGGGFDTNCTVTATRD